MARLVVLEAPSGLNFGIDTMCYTTGERFQGVRGIPAGLHFCHHGVGDGTEGFGGRHGFFFLVSSPSDVVVRKWDLATEDLVPPSTSLTEGSLAALGHAALHGQLDANLGPYPVDQQDLWQRLTAHVSESVLQRCALGLDVKVLPGVAGEELDSDDEGEGAATMLPFFAFVMVLSGNIW